MDSLQSHRLQEKLADFKAREVGICWRAEMRSVFGEPVAVRDDPVVTGVGAHVVRRLRAGADFPVEVKVASRTDLANALRDQVSEVLEITGPVYGKGLLTLTREQFLDGFGSLPFSFEDLIVKNEDGRILLIERPDARDEDRIEAREFGSYGSLHDYRTRNGFDSEEELRYALQSPLGLEKIGGRELTDAALKGVYERPSAGFELLSDALKAYRVGLESLSAEDLIFFSNCQGSEPFWATRELVVDALPRVNQEYLDCHGDLICISPEDRRCLHLELERRPERFELRDFSF